MVDSRVLAVNAGSSSIRFALYGTDRSLVRRGKLERIGERGNAGLELIESLDRERLLDGVAAVGHRVVHGGLKYSAPSLIDAELLAELRRICPFDPEHLPLEIALIERFRKRLPQTPQIACFDTAFHRQMPRVAQLLPLPRRLDEQGIRRFGFHGLSYAYLMGELERIAGQDAAQARIVLAHLGNGSSLAAVHQGKSIDTTMAFTPAAGVPMSTRAGDLDPGLGWYLARTENMSAEAFNHMVNHESGLLGVSQTSADLRDLLACEATDARAAEAIALYCYQIGKSIGALAAALGGLDTLIFAGGIGENAAPIRQRICERLGFLGIRLDEGHNAAHRDIISDGTATVTVRVIATDEEAMIARATRQECP